MGLQHTTEVWYSGSCTNKHDKLMDTPIDVLCNVISFMFHIRLVQSTMPRRVKLQTSQLLQVWVSYAVTNEMAKIMVAPS